MKAIITAIIPVLLCLNGLSQKTVELTKKVQEHDKLTLEFQFADSINIKTWNKNEVYVKATVSINGNEDNDRFKINSSEMNGSIKIESEIEDLDEIGKEQTIVKKNGETIRVENRVEIDMYVEVFVPKNGSIKTSTISGNIHASGLSDDVELKSISGSLDVSWNEKAGTNLVLKTISGDMYSDFDLPATKKDGMAGFLPRNYSCELNNGGKHLTLETISGNIYLRKE